MSAGLVTLVFTDLVNSTGVKSEMAGETLADRNRAYLETILLPHRHRVEFDLETWGGRVVDTAGDGYFLVFTDALRAVLWAAQVQESHVSEPIPTPLGPLQVKIGMHTGGPIPLGRGFIGQEVDYAARVSSLAAGEQILLSEATAALAEAASPAVVLHAHGRFELKGIGPVPVFESLYGGRPPRPPKAAPFRPSNLPPSPGGFLGRTGDLADLRRRLDEGGLTCLAGEGGMGKTSLALAAAHAAYAAGQLSGGVVWINCELQPGLEECLRQMAHVLLGDRMENESVERCSGRVLEYLGRERALVILDNFESVARNTALVRWLGKAPPPVRLLLTTRELAPGFRGRVLHVRELPRAEAIALFLERARAVGWSGDGEEHVEALCAAVGDQPLALELLAARAAGVPLVRLLERVRRDLKVLDARGDPTRPDRHQSARACFSMSYDALSSEAQELLNRLSVLPAGAGPEVIEAVVETDDWDEAAEELEAASVWRLANGRYTLHPLVRQFVQEQCGAARPDAERQAARTLAPLALTRSEQLRPGASAPEVTRIALEWFEAEWPNLMAAAQFALDAQDWEAVRSLAHATRFCIGVRGSWSELEGLYERALALARAVGVLEGEGDVLNHLGTVYSLRGRRAEAVECFQRRLKIVRALGNRTGEGQALSNLANILVQEERFADAEAALYESLDIRREVGDSLGEGRILNNLGYMYHRQGRWQDAEAAYRASLAIKKAANDRFGEGLALNNLGEALLHLGKREEAERCLCQSLEIRREFHDRPGEGETLRNLAELYASRGALPDALEAARLAVDVLEKTEDTAGLRRSRDLLTRLQHAPGV